MPGGQQDGGRDAPPRPLPRPVVLKTDRDGCAFAPAKSPVKTVVRNAKTAVKNMFKTKPPRPPPPNVPPPPTSHQTTPTSPRSAVPTAAAVRATGPGSGSEMSIEPSIIPRKVASGLVTVTMEECVVGEVIPDTGKYLFGGCYPDMG